MMKVSKLYTNKPDIFMPIKFRQGLNVILAEIRLHDNYKEDTHNLGKTTLGRLLDFCFLKEKDKTFFLIKHFDLFKNFVFFLELELNTGSYLTICRSVNQPTKVSFKKHDKAHQDFTNIEKKSWDHLDMPFDKAKKMLDSLLDWRDLKPWGFRKILGYLLRSQSDFEDVFQLKKFKGKHADWKPFLAHALGFDGQTILRHYKCEEELKKKEAEETAIKTELGGTVEDISKIEGTLLLKKEDVKKQQKFLDAFDFRKQDMIKTTNVVEEVDNEIGRLNAQRYSIEYNLKKIQKSLDEDKILFDPQEAQDLFEQAGVLFQGQIKKDFEQLIHFNRAITDERQKYLEEEKSELQNELEQINEKLGDLGEKRSEMLKFLSSTDVFEKYKKVSNELVDLRAQVTSLKQQRDHLESLKAYRDEIRNLNSNLRKYQARVEKNVEEQNADENSLFSSIRLFFSEIVEAVISRKALLTVTPNTVGHLEFKAEIFDEKGNATSADDGHTYKKFLCIAFDLAVLLAHNGKKFPRFAFHDGVFESLDDRKKRNLLAVLRRYEAQSQLLITLIDSDLPPKENGKPVLHTEEIVLKLHDEGESGRLFKMDSW